MKLSRATTTRPLLTTLLACALSGAPAIAQDDDRPVDAPDRPELEGVRIDAQIGQTIPLDITFLDEEGRTVTLADYFQDGKPVVLNLGYYRCPMLCGLVWEGLSDAVRKLNWTAGDEYRIVTVSINPEEDPSLAKQKKVNIIRSMGRPEIAEGWHYLTGEQGEIDRLADAVGFRYNWVEEAQEYAHPAAIIILSPDGKVCRYMTGIQYPTLEMKLSLMDAAEGKAGSFMDQFIMTCFQYDASQGKYTFAAMTLMRVGGALTAFSIGAFIVIMVIRESSKRRAEIEATPEYAQAT